MTVLVNRYSGAIWVRNFRTWRHMLWSSMASNVANPLIFLVAFGFGLGSFIDSVDGLPYLAFILPGMMAYSAMFSSSFETTISAFARFNMQRTWDAMLATPLTLAELLTGELLWAATKGMIAATCVLIVGLIWGGVISIGGALIAMPAIFLGCLGFAAYGLLGTSFARGWEFFSYFFTFWVTPMFVFSGTFFEVDRFPSLIQVLAWALPMTHLIAVVRPLITGGEIGLMPGLGHLCYMSLLAVLAFWLAHRRFAKRLFD